MDTLTVPGAHLAYEITGSGPLLLLIPGASGTGASFRPLVPHLSARYQVVTYDRRGFSRSTLDGPQDYEQRFTTDADDARRLLAHLTDQPALIFGNSSGALVALELLCCAPEQIQMVVAHEAPAVTLLPDAARWLAFLDMVYETYRSKGVSDAMHQFADGALSAADHQALHQVMREQANEYTLPNATHWLEYEVRQYPRVELDRARLAAHVERITLAAGRDAQDALPVLPNKELARLLGRDIALFPGGHLGFIASPGEFAAALLAVLTR